MNYCIRPFLIALQFLTRLPLSIHCEHSEKNIARSLLYYPLVGLIIGFLLALSIYGLGHTSSSSMISAACVLTLWVLISGALHLDGLADSADAWIGGYGDREKTLAIMKDPCSGPAAVVLLCLVLLLKFVALEHIIRTYNEHFLWLIIAIPYLARTLMLLLFFSTPYARKSGLGTAFAQYLPRTTAAIVIVFSLAAIPLCIGIQTQGILLAAALTFLIARRIMLLRIGGCTGDTAGALLELSECTMLLSAALTFSAT